MRLQPPPIEINNQGGKILHIVGFMHAAQAYLIQRIPLRGSREGYRLSRRNTRLPGISSVRKHGRIIKQNKYGNGAYRRRQR
jgi:hypothetical protein